jgi:C-terminal processing protease CtpA/Prc
VLRYEAARLFARQEHRGAPVKLVLEDPEGKRHEVEVAAKAAGSRYIPRRPVPIEGSDDAADVSWAKLGDGVGYVFVRRIKGDLPESLDKALAALGDIRSLVIDVRGNSGGGFDAARAIRNFAADDPEEPQRPRFKGPIALLIDDRCISAGEGWASWFIATRRAKLFGSATAGASSRNVNYTLTNGLYSVVVPVKAYTGSLDRPIECRGLEPDVPVRCNAKDLAAGKDTVLETAKQYLLEVSAKERRRRSITDQTDRRGRAAEAGGDGDAAAD